ncbi:hypothetical protein [Helicobacter sp. 23-1045]
MKRAKGIRDSQNLKAICYNKILRFAPKSQNLNGKMWQILRFYARFCEKC